MVKQGAIEAHVHSGEAWATRAQTLIQRSLNSEDEKRVALAKKLQAHIKACKKTMKAAKEDPKDAEKVEKAKDMMKECKVLYASLRSLDKEAHADEPNAPHTLSAESALAVNAVDIKAQVATAARGDLQLTQVKTTKVEGEDPTVQATSVHVSAGVADHIAIQARGGEVAAASLKHVATGKGADVQSMAGAAGQAEDIHYTHKRAVMINGKVADVNPKDGSSAEQALADAFQKAAQESQVKKTEVKGGETKTEMVQDPKVKMAFLAAAMQHGGGGSANMMSSSSQASVPVAPAVAAGEENTSPARRPTPTPMSEEAKEERREAQKKYRAALRKALIEHLKRQQAAEEAATKAKAE